MGKILTAIFGATVVGFLFSMRKFIGIAFVIGVGVTTFGKFYNNMSQQSDAHTEKMAQQIAAAREQRCQRPDVQSAMRQLKIGEDFEVTIMQSIKTAMAANNQEKVDQLRRNFNDIDAVTATYRKVLIDSNCWS